VSRVLLIRHAHAGERSDWSGDDRLRPLSPRGEVQAAGLVSTLARCRIDHLFTSGFVRCRQTVEPLAAARQLPVEEADWLAEGAVSIKAVRRLIAAGEAAACSHGDVISGVLFDLAAEGVALGEKPRMQKGSTWILEVEAGRVVAARYMPPPG
jgi:8-oxo-(d)GTP phosphatase